MEWLSPRSYWHATSTPPAARPPLAEEIDTDVVVIGGGITGLTAAFHLTEAGRRVVVLEAGRIGAGTTGGTSGHLDVLPDQGIDQLIRDHGKEAAALVTQARLASIDQITSRCAQWEIAGACDRVPGYAYSESPEGAEKRAAQAEVLRDVGVSAAPIRDCGLPFPCAGGLRVENQGRLHSMRYLHALAAHLDGNGCTIYEHTRAHPPSDGTPCAVETDAGRVTARDVLLCTHSAFLGISQIDFRVAPTQSYVMTLLIDGSLPDALFWDDASPYHYLRRAEGDDPQRVILGGADHKTGQGGDERTHYRKLEEYARARFKVREIAGQWSAELFEPFDGLPFAGLVPFTDHVYLAAGFSGTGLTLGTVCGQLLAECVLERPPALARVLSPARFKPLASAGKFLSENMNVAKRFVMDRLSPHPVRNLDQVALGEGRLIDYKGHALAAYRDDQGLLHLRSPSCTHAGCFVQWNEAEKTWDCPCHGGRYSATGERLYGPPPHDLEPKHRDEL